MNENTFISQTMVSKPFQTFLVFFPSFFVFFPGKKISGGQQTMTKKHTTTVDSFSNHFCVVVSNAFLFSPQKLGKISNLTNIFQLGCFNHQPDF